MTHKNVTDKWLDAQAHPENYSDEELDELLFSQGRGTDLLKRASAYDEAKQSVDAEEEWKRFEAKHSSWQRLGMTSPWRRPGMRIAAAFAGLLMLSGISYAAYHIASHQAMDEKAMAVADSVKTSPADKEKTVAGQDWIKIDSTKHAPVVFEDAELSTILKYIAEKANVKVEYRNASAAHVRFYLQWDSKDSLQDIIDKINHFEKFHVTFDEVNQLLIVK